jgi:hypothetical protein
MAQLDVPAEPSGASFRLLLRRLQHLPDGLHSGAIADHKAFIFHDYPIDGAIIVKL